MTTEERNMIIELQQQGLGYKKIAALTGLSVNNVKSYCHRHPIVVATAQDQQALCRNCGKPIKRMPQAKPRQYCDDKCRNQFWNSHREEIKLRAFYTFRCPYCGREFKAYGNPNRKYCSRECMANARRKGGATDER